MLFQSLFSKKHMILLAGLITMFVFLWFIMFAVPNLFVYLFDTFLGNFILFVFIVMAAMQNVKFALGLAAIFVILFRFSYMTASRYRDSFII